MLAWLREGRPLHFAVGLLFTVLLFLIALVGHNLAWWGGPVTNFVAVLGLALAHEQSDCDGVTWSDFREANGGPVNGLLDVLAFLPAPVAWLFTWMLLQ